MKECHQCDQNVLEWRGRAQPGETRRETALDLRWKEADESRGIIRAAYGTTESAKYRSGMWSGGCRCGTSLM